MTYLNAFEKKYFTRRFAHPDVRRDTIPLEEMKAIIADLKEAEYGNCLNDAFEKATKEIKESRLTSDLDLALNEKEYFYYVERILKEAEANLNSKDTDMCNALTSHAFRNFSWK